MLGLSLATVLQGFARVGRLRPQVHMGWLVPLLGLFVMLDVASFWNGAWRARDLIQPEYGYLFLGLVVTGTYYLAAASVFPESGETVADFDTHYFKNRRWILLAIGLCNLAVFGWLDFAHAAEMPLTWWIFLPAYFALLITAAFTRSKSVGIACLAALSGMYVFLAIRSLVSMAG